MRTQDIEIYFEWDAADVSDSQLYPLANNVESEGFTFRRCGGDGEWAEEVD